MVFQPFNKQKGQALVELLIAIALAAVILPALLTGFVTSREGKAAEQQRLEATALLRESSEALRNIREKGWSNISTNGTYHPTVSGSSWTLVSGSETVNDLTRQVVISDVQRDSSGNIVTSGAIDSSTKKVIHTVSWSTPNFGYVTATEYFQRYLGNTTLTQTTQADFDAGTFSGTKSTSTGGGTVELRPGSGGPIFTDDYTTSSDYNFDSSKVEVTGGYARLKNNGVAVSGSTLNSDFTLASTGWTFGTWGQNVSQTGTWQSSGGNTGGYVNINFPTAKTKTGGGYWYQAFTTTAPNPTATLTFQYQVSNYQATPTSFHLFVYIDTGLGIPTTRVWDSGNITATSAWSGTVTVNAAPYVTTAGTYYVKIAAQVNYPNSTIGPYTVGYDNVLLSWDATTNVYASDSPTVSPTSSFSASTITSWDSFTETSVLNGGAINYQLSDDDGATWKYHSGGAATNWVTATLSTQYNSATVVNQKIGGFPTTNGKIRVKAFLVGNGMQQVKLDRIVIGYTGTVGTNNGIFTSSTMDAGSTVGFNRYVWTETNTANTTTKLRIATNTDNSTWIYKGPDGTNATYFTGGSGTIHLNDVSGRYFRYEITFSSTTNDLPNVSDVIVNYSP